MAINTLTDGFFGGVTLAVGTSPVKHFIINGYYQGFSEFVAQLTTTGGATYSVQLEGSIDNINWFLIGEPMTSDGVYPQSTPGVYATFIRANVTAATGGTNPTIFMYYVAVV